jgi:hypothetical protein
MHVRRKELHDKVSAESNDVSRPPNYSLFPKYTILSKSSASVSRELNSSLQADDLPIIDRVRISKNGVFSLLISAS